MAPSAMFYIQERKVQIFQKKEGKMQKFNAEAVKRAQAEIWAQESRNVNNPLISAEDRPQWYKLVKRNWARPYPFQENKKLNFLEECKRLADSPGDSK